jgi:hypothetical protein
MFGIASFVANIATVLVLFFLAYEIRSSNRSQELEGANHLFALLNDAEARKARRLVYDAFKNKIDLARDDDSAAKVTADLDQVAIMVRKKLVPKDVAFRTYSRMTIQCWTALENWIDRQRQLRNQHVSWAEDFEWFYNESMKYRKKKYCNENPNPPIY